MIALPTESRPPWLDWCSAVPRCVLCRQWSDSEHRRHWPDGYLCWKCENTIDRAKLGNGKAKEHPSHKRWAKANPLREWAYLTTEFALGYEPTGYRKPTLKRQFTHPSLARWMRKHPIEEWATIEITRPHGTTRTEPTGPVPPVEPLNAALKPRQSRSAAGVPCRLRRRVDGIVIECVLLDVTADSFVVRTKAGERTFQADRVEVVT